MADTIVLTVVPGKKASFYHEVMGEVRFSVKVAHKQGLKTVKLVRAMPQVSASINSGISSAWADSSAADKSSRDQCDELLR